MKQTDVQKAAAIAKAIIDDDWKAAPPDVGRVQVMETAQQTAIEKLNWIEVNIPYGPVYDRRHTTELDSLRKRGLVVAGTMIEMQQNGERFILGDINTLRGQCDDCTAFDSSAVVARYCVLWEGDY